MDLWVYIDSTFSFPLVFCREIEHVCKNQFIYCGRSNYGTICDGDSGGPLICEEDGMAVLHGIISSVTVTGVVGLNECPANAQNNFSSIYDFLSFIKHTLVKLLSFIANYTIQLSVCKISFFFYSG